MRAWRRIRTLGLLAGTLATLGVGWGLAWASAPILPRTPDSPSPTEADPCPTGCIQFVVNVHDVNHVADSADTLIHLTDIFARHGVRGEFYFTGSIVELYAAERPDVLERIRTAGMAVSYHVRAPHPLVKGFDGALAGKSEAQVEAILRDAETYALDRATGQLDRTRPGGYALVRDTFGRPPVTVVAPNPDPALRLAAVRVYRALGARALVWYHEEKSSLAHPLQTREGLVVRPSDIGVTRWPVEGGTKDQFWWNRVERDPAFYPASYLKQRLEAWSGEAAKSGTPQPTKGKRGAFVTSLVHENNFYRAGPEGWTYSYYTAKDKDTPLPPPWDLHPREGSTVRTASEQAAIWGAYEALVRWSAAHLRVVTGDELADLGARVGALPAPERGSANHGSESQ